MKTCNLSDAFEAFDHKPVIINTKLEITTPEGVGVMQYRGVLIDKDDFMVYLGVNLQDITTAVKWEDIATIELMDMDAEIANELLKKEPGSGAKN